MTSTVIDEATRTNLRNALLSPDLHIGEGVGSVDGERCTIAEINLVLTGQLTDKSHPCISEVIRRWVIRVQDGMPDEIRNSVAWRTAAIGIAGSASIPEEVEKQRVALILNWMWEALADDAVLAVVPESVRPAWDTMLTERTSDAAHDADDASAVVAYAAYYAARARAAGDAAASTAAYAATNVAHAVTYANDAVIYAANAAYTVGVDVVNAYWERRDPAKLLTELIEVQ